jgi:hypothetical protein
MTSDDVTADQSGVPALRYSRSLRSETLHKSTCHSPAVKTGLRCFPIAKSASIAAPPVAAAQQLKSWVQSWVQLEGLSQPKIDRKLRRINERLNGYEPGGRLVRKGIKKHPAHSLPCRFSFNYGGSLIGNDYRLRNRAQLNERLKRTRTARMIRQLRSLGDRVEPLTVQVNPA